MQQLIATIENLLIEHDCVVVPGLGGFIHQQQDAYYDANSSLFYPSGKQLAFNARLHYNDGLLCQAYQMELGLSFDMANLRIRQAVCELKDYLAQYRHLSVGRLGQLIQQADTLVFEPALRNDLCALSFGLKPCAFPADKQIHLETRSSASPWLSYVATIAACLLLLFTFMQDNHYLSESSLPQQIKVQEAAVMPLCSVKPVDTSVETMTSYEHLAELASETEVASEMEAETEVVAEVATETETRTETEAVTAAVTETKETSKVITDAVESSLHNYPGAQKQYLIVIASFPTAEQAEQYIQSRHLQEQFSSVGIAVSADRCRVYAQAYSDKSEALSHLDEFRQANPKYAKAWVLVH
ncbi:MAG: hypothetical protein J6Q25_07510 [Bacteroidales bacterium]|nr:hypothetical protein [Bacteroidales bacterium]